MLNSSSRLGRGVLAFSVIALTLSVPTVRAQKAEQTIVPNYDLAAQWTSQKVSKLVFDTT